MLNLLQIETIVARDGVAAIETATDENANFVAILMECEMPDVDA